MGISERFLKSFAGTRISERFWTFYGDQNLSVFFFGTSLWESEFLNVF